MVETLRRSVSYKVDTALDLGGALNQRNAIAICQRLVTLQPLFVEEPARSDKA